MNLECSFCGRATGEVATFFRPGRQTPTPEAAPICICDRCIETCHKRLAAKKEYSIEPIEKQRLREAVEESTTDTLIRAIVENDYRDLFLEIFSEIADLAELDPDMPPEPGALHLLPASFLRENRILPWRIEGDRLVVAFYNPLHLLDIYDEISYRAGMPIRPAMLKRDRLLESINRYVKSEE